LPEVLVVGAVVGREAMAEGRWVVEGTVVGVAENRATEEEVREGRMAVMAGASSSENMTALALATVIVWSSDCWRRLEFTSAGITPTIDIPIQ